MTDLAFLEDLDVVRVSPERHHSSVIDVNLLRASRVAKLALIVYRRLALHPWQAFDHPLFSPGERLADVLSGPDFPVTFYYPVEKPTFEGCLEGFLRQSGSKAFVFSSVQEGTTVARDWGALVQEEWSRATLFDRAGSHNREYARMIETAIACDRKRVRIQESTASTFEFAKIAKACSGEALVHFSTSPQWASGWPDSRSHAQQGFKVDLGSQRDSCSTKLDELMEPYDHLYNVLVADAFGAIAVTSLPVPEREAGDHVLIEALAGPRGAPLAIQFNYERLTTKYSGFAHCLDRHSAQAVVKVTRSEKIAQHVADGWVALEHGDVPRAGAAFDHALNEAWSALEALPDENQNTGSTAVARFSLPDIPIRYADIELGTLQEWRELGAIITQALGRKLRPIHGVVHVRDATRPA
ncbi:MAG: hypothetical protein Q8K82_04600 [Gemmatimonadaceae bacterium]|nr:hypothetical protein [Gemmatimonadaceae bacterium]